jgi:hypothetical protein
MRCPTCRHRLPPWRFVFTPRPGRPFHCGGCGATLVRSRRSRTERLLGWLSFWAAMLTAFRFYDAPSWGWGFVLALVLIAGTGLEASLLALQPARPGAAP